MSSPPSTFVRLPGRRAAAAGLVLLYCCLMAAIRAAETNLPPSRALPKVYYADPHALAEAKAKFAGRDISLQPAFDRLLLEAEEALKFKPVAVTEKQKVPPSGDKHDYISQAPYHWPNPQTSNGLPYIRRDGERNPESQVHSDEMRFVGVSTQVQTLALAFYLTDREPYAAHAASLLRVFFLNPDTRMNPNLNFGQAIPGETEGRGSGLIEVRSLVQIADSLQLLATSKAWRPADQTAMRGWIEAYLQWLTTSKNGRDEARASNNHGTFYDTQLAALALFLGNTNLARSTLEAAGQKRIASQIEPDGRQPRELVRTRSLFYSLFNLKALMDLASIGQNAGVDLWHYHTADGRSLRQALAFLLPYANPATSWPHPQIIPLNRSLYEEVILRAAAQYPDLACADALKHFDAQALAANRARLLFRTAVIPRPSGDRTNP